MEKKTGSGKIRIQLYSESECGCVSSWPGLYPPDLGDKQPAIRAGQPKRLRHRVIFTGRDTEEVPTLRQANLTSRTKY